MNLSNATAEDLKAFAAFFRIVKNYIKMKELLITLIICLASISCKDGKFIGSTKGEPVDSTKPDYRVEYLFTVDSVKVYGFSDNGRQYIAIGKQGIAISQP